LQTKDLTYKDKNIQLNFNKKNETKIEQLEKNKLKLEKELNSLERENAKEERRKKIKKIEENRSDLDNKLKKLTEFIKEKAPDFIDKIEWKADKKDKESSIDDFIESIEQEISKIDGLKLDSDSAFSHLIYKVLVASQAKNIDDRR